MKGYLELLRSVAKKLGIVTSLRKPIAKAILRDLKIDNDFDTLVAYGDTRPHKPQPHPVLKALSNLSIPPSNCIYVGDQKSDVFAGKRAGVLTGLLLWKGEKLVIEDSDPDFYFSSFQDILAVAEKYQ